MRLRYILFIIAGVIFCLSLFRCRKFVQIGPPIDQLVTESVFSNDAQATSAQTSIYAQMKNESFNIAKSTGLLVDELDALFTTDVDFVNYYTDNMQSTNSGAGPWINAYNYIFQANNILFQIQDNDKIHIGIRQQLRGESLFIRAFWLFYLTNCYGDVPIVTTTDYSVNATISRSPQANVYKQIISDLSEAIGLLNSNYVDANDTSITIERIRPNQWAAKALLSRVYLYLKQYGKAEENSNDIINHTDLYGLVNNLDSVFLANSDEAIWQLSPPVPNTINTVDGSNFVIISAPVTGNNTLTISNFLISNFEPGDKRKVSWINEYTNLTSGITYYYPYKYKIRSSTTVTEYTMVLRLAEQYLIRAEARAEQNKLDDAINDLDIIRRRAGLGVYGGSKNKDSVLNAILRERQVELFSEWGHRWFDLIRTGHINNVMNTVAPMKNGVWSPYKAMFPLPQSELISDNRLIQNAGY